MVFPDTQKPRGFGYVTFETLENLEAALSKDGESLLGREVKVDVSEGPRQKESSSSNWGRDRDTRRDRDFEREPREPREAREAPAERPKVVVAPRTLPIENPVPVPAPAPASPDAPAEEPEDSKSPSQPKANPFGDAKPRDQLAIQRAFEERQKEKERLERE